MFSKKYGVEEFGRTGRQRAVMQATFHKMLQQNPLDLVDIAIDALGDVSTDMDATYIKKLILSVAKMGTTEIDQLRVPIENTYKTAVAGSYPPCGYVFFVNFKANQEALKYFMFNKGKRQDFAKNYGVQMLLRHVDILPNTTITVQKVILGTYLTALTLQKESSAY